jgi:hypothetical protein
MQHNQPDEQPIYVQHIKRHYGAVVHVLWFIATETSDKGADIAARALALLAPLPNAVSVFNVSQVSLGYTRMQAFAFAMAMELALFAIIEVALHMWDGYLSNPKRYTVPLGASIVASVGVLVIVMSVVYHLEVKSGGHWILALLPLISMFAFVALGLKRWHERGAPSKHSANAQKHSKRTVHRDAQPTAQPAQSDAQIVVIDKRQHAKQMKAEGFTVAQIADRFNVHRNTASAWTKETNGYHKEAAQ